MVLVTSLVNTQQYKVRINDKVAQSKERSNAPLHFGVVAIEKGAFGLPSTTVANLDVYLSSLNLLKRKSKHFSVKYARNILCIINQ